MRINDAHRIVVWEWQVEALCHAWDLDLEGNRACWRDRAQLRHCHRRATLTLVCIHL